MQDLTQIGRSSMASGGEEATAKSRILVVGGTGYIGRHVVSAGARMGHPTTALVRDLSPSDPAKAQLLQTFRDAGVTLLHGDLYDHASLVRAVRDADVVVSALRAPQIPDQTNLIAAIKEAGVPISRFVPSEFGMDPERSDGAVEPVKSIYASKVRVRRALEAAGIPHTYVVCNYFAGFALPTIGQFLPMSPPVDSVVILGDGSSTKVVFVEEGDIGTFTVMAAVDPRIENKTVHIRPPANTVSHEKLVAMWEKKTGKKLERVYVPEDAVLKRIQGSAFPLNIILSIAHAAYIRGEMTTPLDPASDVEATELYPDVKYTSVDDYLNRLL